jgi:hypothetical protein
LRCDETLEFVEHALDLVAIRMASGPVLAAATPTISEETETMPSLAPRTAAPS